MEHPRLSKLMSLRGLCSRREADRFIAQGLVRVDGETVADLGARIDPRRAITLADEARAQQRGLATVLLHKPSGYVSGSPEKGHRAAVTLVTESNRQHP
ncbi:MAG: S4 domain-containing protein, partial [bacterium]